MMKLYQTAIFTGVMFAFIYFDVRGEGYSEPVVAVIAAYLFSIVPLKIYDLWMTWRERLYRRRFTGRY